MYAEVITRFSVFTISFLPRHSQTIKDIKNPLAILHPQCLEIMLTKFGGEWKKSLGRVYNILEYIQIVFQTIHNSWLPVGWSTDCHHESCSARWVGKMVCAKKNKKSLKMGNKTFYGFTVKFWQPQCIFFLLKICQFFYSVVLISI